MADKSRQAAAIEAARSAGLDVSALEEQVAERAARPDLAEKVEKLAATLEARVPEPPATPEQRERATADRLLAHLKASQTPWFSPSSGGDDRG